MLTVENVEEHIDEKIREGYFLGKTIEVTLPEEPSAAVLERAISPFSSVGWILEGRSGNTIRITTAAGLN